MGKEVLVSEHTYHTHLESILQKISPLEDVLEIGFSERSRLIARFSPKTHVILEENPDLAKKARRWGKAVVVEAPVEEGLNGLGVFDLILYDEIDGAETVESESVQNASLLVQKGKQLVTNIEKTLPDLTSYLYRDEDLEILYSKVPSEQISPFLSDLVEKNQISVEQYQRFLQKHGLKESPHKGAKNRDLLYSILKKCLEGHMKPNGFFLSLSPHSTSKYENTHFFESIITNPELTYSEKTIDTGLFLQIEKCT